MPTKEKTETKAFQPKIVKNITLPLIKPQLDKPFYIKVTSPMFEGKKIESGDKASMEPATLVNCIDLETGAESQLIVPSVLHGIFDDEYKDDSYVDKGFMITKHPKVSGKRYHAFSVAEIEV